MAGVCGEINRRGMIPIATIALGDDGRSMAIFPYIRTSPEHLASALMDAVAKLQAPARKDASEEAK